MITILWGGYIHMTVDSDDVLHGYFQVEQLYVISQIKQRGAAKLTLCQ